MDSLAIKTKKHNLSTWSKNSCKLIGLFQTHPRMLDNIKRATNQVVRVDSTIALYIHLSFCAKNISGLESPLWQNRLP